jgi:hypothetical protein
MAPKRKPKQLELPIAAQQRIRNIEIAIDSLAESVRELENFEGAANVYFRVMAEVCGVENELREALKDEIRERDRKAAVS